MDHGQADNVSLVGAVYVSLTVCGQIATKWHTHLCALGGFIFVFRGVFE